MATFRTAAGRAAALILTLGALAAVAAAPSSAQDKPLGKAEIERIVHDYLRAHPEIVFEAMETHKKNQEAAEQAAVAAALEARQSEILADPDSPVGGNPSGDVTLVEFFDYRCGICKRVHPMITELIKSDGKVRLVYKEWPILGPNSLYATRAALASRKQGKYLAFHDAMMASRTRLTPQAVMLIAKRVGLDVDRLRRDIEDPAITAIVERNYKLAEALKIRGTPSFVIGGTVVGGARDMESMRKLIADARGTKAE